MLFLLIFITFIWSFDLIKNFLEDMKSMIFISIFLFIDIFLQFNIAIIIKGQVIKNRVQIIKHYLTGQFFEDVLFLFSLIVLINTQQIVIAAVFYACGTKILYKIINKFQDIFDLSMYSSEVMKLIKLILFINLIAHFIACVWHYVGQNTGHLGHTWLDSKGIRNESAFIRYVYSFYWSVLTMVTVGYGDIVPINYLEMLVSVFVMFLSCGVFAFSLNLIGQIVSTVNQEKVKLEKNIIQKKLSIICFSLIQQQYEPTKSSKNNFQQYNICLKNSAEISIKIFADKNSAKISAIIFAEKLQLKFQLKFLLKISVNITAESRKNRLCSIFFRQYQNSQQLLQIAQCG